MSLNPLQSASSWTLAMQSAFETLLEDRRIAAVAVGKTVHN